MEAQHPKQELSSFTTSGNFTDIDILKMKIYFVYIYYFGKTSLMLTMFCLSSD